MQIANLRHAYYGLRLALRGRIGLRADIIDFDNPEKTFALGDELAADFMWNVFEDMQSQTGLLGDCDRQSLGSELGALFSSGKLDSACDQVPWAVVSQYEELTKAIQWTRNAREDKVNQALVCEPDRKLYDSSETGVVDEYNYSALELLANISVHDGTLDESKAGRSFVPRKFEARDAN